MGTSNPNLGTSGNGTPLVPSWLDPGSSSIDVGDGTQPNNPGDAQPPIPEPAEPNRYQAPRAAFSRFARSGGRDRRSMGRAVSGYISSVSGGSRGAAQKMGSSRGTAAKIVGFLNEVSTRGLAETLQSLNLGDLVGKPIDQVFLGLSDLILPEGGSTDIGIARDAFVRTIAELASSSSVDIDNLSRDQIRVVLETYATNAIELRIYNDVGMKTVFAPSNETEAQSVQDTFHNFVEGGVNEALNDLEAAGVELDPEHMLDYVDKVYERAFDFLDALANEQENEE